MRLPAADQKEKNILMIKYILMRSKREKGD